MMALQPLLILQVVVIVFAPALLAYPTVYGTKRYGRSSSHHRINGPYQPALRHGYPPSNYYELNPYSQNYPEEFYYPQEYPVYYPPARTSKYEVYQAVLPYYYGDRPFARAGYGYYDDLQDELLQEAEREEREEAQPIGHELLYETGDDQAHDELDDVNAAFLQNLIMSQMYKDAIDQKDYYDQYADYTPSLDDIYGKWEETETNPGRYQQEDEDVRELKQLAKPNAAENRGRKEKLPNDIHWFKHGNFLNQKVDEKKSLAERKPAAKKVVATTTTTTTAATPATTHLPADKAAPAGQKEEMLLRPATPVRHPFTDSVLEMVKGEQSGRKRTPSVYHTIKHMLDVEKSFENKYRDVDEIRPQMKKRIISSEESLTHQLSVLKKAQ